MSSRPWILAVDFGTSYTVAVALAEGRAPEVLEIGGERRVPSVVLAEDGNRVVVGRVADELSATNPGSTLRAPKSRLGDQAPVVLGGRPFQVVQLVAALLAWVYDEAVRQMGAPPDEVRLTHPATWNRPWLNRLLEAAAKAGLPRTVLVPEPVAAALSYASEVGVTTGDHVVVYDLGGGTFDTAVVTATGGGFTVVGRPGGDASIGGELFDELLVNEIGDRLAPDVWDAIQVAGDATWLRVAASLRGEARRAKETLSSHPYADVLLPLPSGLAQLRITRDEYEELITPYVEETVTLLGRCIANAGLIPASVAAIYLVGGVSRTPLVERLVTEAFPGVPVSRRGDPKTAVAMGAVRAVAVAGAAVAGGAQLSTEDAAAPTADQELALGTPPAVSPPPSQPPAPRPSGPAPVLPPPVTPPPVTPPPVTPPPMVPLPVAPPAPRVASTPTPPPPGAPPAAITVAPPASEATRPSRKSPPRRRGVLIGIAAGVIGLAVIVGAMIALSGGGGSSSDTSSPGGTVTTQKRGTTTLPGTTAAGTVVPVDVSTLEAKLLTLDEVNKEAGGGFVTVDLVRPGPEVCGIEIVPTQVSAVRYFDNATTGARVGSAIDRYATVAAARRAWDAEVSLRTTCANRSYLINGVPYLTTIVPFDSALPAALTSNGREILGLLIGYTMDTSATTVAGSAGAAQQIYEFVVETIDGPNIVGAAYVAVNRPLTNEEISAYIHLFELAVSRATS